jgi:hypothetical protein
MSGKRYSPEEIVGIFESKASAAWQKMRAKLVNTGFMNKPSGLECWSSDGLGREPVELFEPTSESPGVEPTTGV